MLHYLFKQSDGDDGIFLFTASLNSGAGDNLCYHPANYQQRNDKMNYWPLL